jgi:hypothetical protein
MAADVAIGDGTLEALGEKMAELGLRGRALVIKFNRVLSSF